MRRSEMPDTTTNEYKCDNCGWIYRAAQHEGKDLSEQPDEFQCPTCQFGRNHFQPFAGDADDLQSDSTDDGTEPPPFVVSPSSNGSSAGAASGILRRVYTESG